MLKLTVEKIRAFPMPTQSMTWRIGTNGGLTYLPPSKLEGVAVKSDAEIVLGKLTATSGQTVAQLSETTGFTKKHVSNQLQLLKRQGQVANQGKSWVALSQFAKMD